MGEPTESDFARIIRKFRSSGPQSVEAELRELHLGAPESIRVTRMLMSSLWALGRRDEARGLLTEAMERAPESPDLLSYQAWMQYEEGDYEGAEETAGHVLDLQPRHPEGALILARAYVARQCYRDALSVLGPALRSPTNRRVSWVVCVQALIGCCAIRVAFVAVVIAIAAATLAGLFLVLMKQPILGIALVASPNLVLLLLSFRTKNRRAAKLAAAGVLLVVVFFSLFSLFWAHL